MQQPRALLLMRLNEHFGVVRSQIQLIKPLPPLNRVFSKVLQHEMQYGLAPVEDTHIAINAASSSYGNGRSRGYYRRGRGFSNGKICTYCDRMGHTIDVCYRKHGFPPNSRYKSSWGVNNAIGEKTESKHEEVIPSKDSTMQPVEGFTQE